MKIIYEKEDLPELQGQIIDVFDDRNPCANPGRACSSEE
jgi:hypothetical protein